MSHEITKAQQMSEEMTSADIELLDEELDTVAGGITVNGGVNGGINTFVENNVTTGYGRSQSYEWEWHWR